jgi:hypothetical protein
MGSVFLSGSMSYKPGFYGLDRPVRTGKVAVYSGTYKSAQNLLAESDTNDSGYFWMVFNVTTPQLFVEIYDYMTNQAFAIVKVTPSQALQLPALPVRLGMIPPPPDIPMDMRKIAVPWEPLLPPLATVNGSDYRMLSEFARGLSSRLRQPAVYPATVSLQREIVGHLKQYPYLSAPEYMVAYFQENGIPTDVAARLCNEVHKVLSLPPITFNNGREERKGTNNGTKSASDALAKILEHLSAIGLDAVEKGSLVKRLLTAIDEAFGFRSPFYPQDPIPDMAAIYVILYMAGLIERDNAKASVTFGKIIPRLIWATNTGNIENRAVFVSLVK